MEQGTVTSLIEEKGTVKGVQYKTKTSQELTAYAPLTIVCDGCFSNLRRSLCNPKVKLPSNSHQYLKMAYQYILAGIVASLFGFALFYNSRTKRMNNHDNISRDECVTTSQIGECRPEISGSTDVIIDGRRVHVIERDLTEQDRIVGELLQPGGYLKLIELGLEDCVNEIDAQPVFGYALFKDGKNTRLSYPLENFHSDVAGRGFHNGRFVQRMREKAASLPNVILEQGTVTSLIEENGIIKGVQYKTNMNQELTANAPLTIVCDGCFSNLRRSLCNPKVDVPSCFVGLVLENCQLPYANHGHVILADPSPILFYPISSTEIRCLVDVPGKKVPSISNGEMSHYLKTTVAPQGAGVDPQFQKRNYMIHSDPILVDGPLILTHDVDAGVLKKVILADGAVVTVKGARSVSLRHPLDLPLPLNRTDNGFASGLLTLADRLRHASRIQGAPLLSLRIVGPTSLTSPSSSSQSSNNRLKLKRLAPGLVELSSPSKTKAIETLNAIDLQEEATTLLTPNRFMTMWPIVSVNGSNSNLLGFEKLLSSVLGPRAKEESSFRLLKADVSAETFMKIGFEVEKKLKEGMV
ncbi:hypothetical protein L1049_014941 [Liquidambar formosana]|uniref:Squalene monooxygenase n=1 Tax=Liquidambar formosana TaxID=63359 RepID=A0AAP0RXA8_LIQFO